MLGMTTTSTWDASLHPRAVGGKFDEKTQTAPELTLVDEAGFDLTSFMQEPPTTPEPFVILQPVVYTNIDGNDEHATVQAIHDNGYLTLTHRTPGSLNDSIDDDGHEFIVDPRYVREDFDVSRDATRRQTAALDGAIVVANEITALSNRELDGLNQYENSLAVRDKLKVGGQENAASAFRAAESAATRAIGDLVHRDLLATEMESWTYLEGYGPDEIVNASEAVSPEGLLVARGATQAAVLEAYGDWSMAEPQTVELLKDALQDARDLGYRIEAAESAADSVDADIDALGADSIKPTLEAAVVGLPTRKASAFRKTVTAMNTAYTELEHQGLIGYENRIWSPSVQSSDVSDAATLGRAAGQAAILRHFKPETGLTDTQLDAITKLFDETIAAHQKAAA